MTTSIERLKARLADYRSIEEAMALLSWDQQTHMPKGGAPARARQLATLSKLAHQTLVSSETADLLAAAEDEAAALDYDADDAAFVRAARRDYDRWAKLPTEWVTTFASTTSQAHHVWEKARAEKDYAAFAPWLTKIIDLCRQRVDYIGYEDRPYDALLDIYEPGMKTAEVGAIFDDLKAGLVPLVQKVLSRAGRTDDSVLHQAYDVDKQWRFGEAIIRDFGYDFERGRQDRSVHPFTTSFSVGDVRITTRFDPNWLAPALFATMHEAGHALYQQNVAQAFEGTILADGASLGVHESQSRLWENIVGRSRGFWGHYYPRLQALFPEQLGNVDVETFYCAVNTVRPSFIRVEADELTYNLHIMLRFELENALLEGDLDVEDAPAAWNDKMEELLGIQPIDDAQGILQDTHWSSGGFGYFPAYSLGNLLSAQLYAKAVADAPDIPDQIARGEFSALLGWMREHVHRHGRKYMPAELVQRATGEPMQARAYMDYLRAKYGAIYGGVRIAAARLASSVARQDRESACDFVFTHVVRSVSRYSVFFVTRRLKPSVNRGKWQARK
ncbi:MAG: carboxypeptidase M32 [Anaerolineae bacterium]|nr:carboxypeptidase M32 [Anaerolineae bacterium]